MKINVKMKWPTWSIETRETEIDVPDNVQNIDDWIYNHEEELIEEKSGGEYLGDLPGAIEAGYAGVEVIGKGEKP